MPSHTWSYLESRQCVLLLVPHIDKNKATTLSLPPSLPPSGATGPGKSAVASAAVAARAGTGRRLRCRARLGTHRPLLTAMVGEEVGLVLLLFFFSWVGFGFGVVWCVLVRFGLVFC